MHAILQCATANPDGRKRALLIGGGIANFTDVAATFNGIIRALREKVCLIELFKILFDCLLGSSFLHPVVFIFSYNRNQS